MTNTAEVQMKPVSELIASMKAAAEKATPGEWYSDHIDTDGTYGSGEDCREGWRAAGVYSEKGDLLLDSSNSEVAIIREEYDEDGFIAFDETGFKNAEFVVACRPENVLALIAALELKEEQRANWFQIAQRLGEEMDAAEKRIVELEASKQPTNEVVDQVCLAAAEIHNRGNGVTDDKAQFIIDRIRGYLASASTVDLGE